MNRLIMLFLCLLVGFGSYAQDLKLPDDKEKADEAKRRFALSVDNMAIKNYRGAANALHWLMTNAPGLYEGLYINGYKAYEELAEKASGDAQNALLDSMFVCYDLKAAEFELSPLEKNNKAYRYYKYWKSNKDKIMEGVAAYEDAYTVDANDIINNNLVSYMDMIRRANAYGNNIADDKIIDIYFQINEVMDQKEAAGEDKSKLDRYRETITSVLIQTIGEEKLNCDFINENLAPGLDQKEDLKLAKKVFGLLLSRQCGDSPYFMKAANIIQREEPTEGLAKVMAQRFAAAKEYDKALEYYNSALSISTDDQKRAQLNLDMSKIHIAQGDKAKARAAALEAAKLDNSLAKEAYSFVAGMYMGSFNDCSQKESQIEDRAVFMAAFDMYQRAGDTEGMNNAKAQFPTVSDVFTANKKEGDAITVGCWIQVKTTIRTRPSDN